MKVHLALTVAALGLVAAGCSDPGGTASGGGGKLGKEGESCTKSDDCEGDLRCVGQTCVADGNCVPGETNACLCTGGASGVQVCKEDGSGWNSCDCGDLPDGLTDTDEQDVGPQELPDGACVATNPTYYKDCVGNDVFWFDNCEQKREFIESCGPSESCNSATGECVAGGCAPKFEEKCQDGDVYWFNSCGEAESIAAVCDDEDFCVQKSCVKGVYSGQYLVTADPDTKSIGIGNITFVPSMFNLTVDGGTAHGENNTVTPPATFDGTLEGKVLKLTGTYVEVSQIAGNTTHQYEMTVTFTAPEDLVGKPPPTDFAGILKEELENSMIGPLGTVIWQITGVKQ